VAADIGSGLDGRAQAVRRLFLRHFAAPPGDILTMSFASCLRCPRTLPPADPEPIGRVPDRTARRWICLP